MNELRGMTLAQLAGVQTVLEGSGDPFAPAALRMIATEIRRKRQAQRIVRF